ncbi:ANKRD50 [Symbiodinium sp. CCMP2592]|nr:ANKRD50 [Symbiodinium sp. CCMP2592]
MVCAYGPSTAEVATLLATLHQQQIAALGSLPIRPAPALAPHMQDPVSVSVNQIAAGADCQWRVNEVAYVATGKEEAEKTEVPACNVPSLVRLAGKGNLEAVRDLLDGGEDPDIMDDLGLTALHAAAKKGHNKIVALLIARGARVNPCAAKWKGPKLGVGFGLSSQRFGV